jgi:hypothetical protein
VYDDRDRAAYREFVERLVDNAVAAARAEHEDASPENVARHVDFDTMLVDEMIQSRIIEITTAGFVRRELRGRRGWAR